MKSVERDGLLVDRPQRSRVTWILRALAPLVMLCFTSFALAQTATPSQSIFHRLNEPFNIGVQGIAATATDNVWALNAGHSIHFDGKSWSEQALVGVGNEFLTMFGPAVVSANDVWSVGFYPVAAQETKQFGQKQPFTLAQEVVQHFDGKQWNVVKDVDLVGKIFKGRPVKFEELTSVVAVSASDVWAAGWIGTDFTIVPFVERFDGKKWSLVANILDGAGSGFLQGISVISDHDVWAVSVIPQNGTTGQAEAFHFDGRKWRQVNVPQVRGLSRFNAVTTLASNDVWAVGYSQNAMGENDETLTQHWNGKKWSVVASPNPRGHASFLNYLTGVAAVSSKSVWADGIYLGPGGESQAMHWDGQRWRLVPLPKAPKGFLGFLEGVAALPSGQVWLGGGAGKANQTRSWILFTDQGK